MTTPLHGVDHRFKSGWAHSNPWHGNEAYLQLNVTLHDYSEAAVVMAFPEMPIRIE